MPGRIVADPRTLAGHAGDLSTLSGEFEREAYRLREALGFVLNRPDIPNGASLMASYTTALQALDTAATSSRQLSTSITRYARRVIDCENTFLRGGDGPYARALPGRGRGIDFPSVGFGWLNPLWGAINVIDDRFDNVKTAVTVVKHLEQLPARTWKYRLVGGRKVVDLLNYGDRDALRAINDISDEGAAAIIAARRSGRFRTPHDVLKVLTQADKERLMRNLRRGPGGGSLDTLGPLGKRMAPLVERLRLAKPLDAVGDVAFKARRLAPAMKFMGKVLSPVDVIGSSWAFGKEWRDKKDDPNLLGGDRVEDVARGTAVVVATTGALVVVGVISAPIVGTVVAVAGVGLVVYEYGPRAWKAAGRAADWAGNKIGDAAGWAGDKAGNAKDWAGDKAGDVKDAVSDKAGDVKDAVSDKAGDAKDWAGDKASSAKKKISGWLPG